MVSRLLDDGEVFKNDVVSDSTRSRIGLCITNSFTLFGFLSFLTALTTVTPQLSMPALLIMTDVCLTT